MTTRRSRLQKKWGLLRMVTLYFFAIDHPEATKTRCHHAQPLEARDAAISCFFFYWFVIFRMIDRSKAQPPLPSVDATRWDVRAQTV